MSLFPWPEALAAALRMGIAPDAFWRLSLKEWRLIAGAEVRAQRLGGAELGELMKAFPDRERQDGGD